MTHSNFLIKYFYRNYSTFSNLFQNTSVTLFQFILENVRTFHIKTKYCNYIVIHFFLNMYFIISIVYSNIRIFAYSEIRYFFYFLFYNNSDIISLILG
ncbi:hypothetical protein J7L48_08445, partial [bacterium]|nr:hypothetical protein [bacterium]